MVISGGSTAIVERLPFGHVRKAPYPDDSPRTRKARLEDIRREHEVYLRISGQPHFLDTVEYSAEQGIILQLMPNGTLRSYLQCQGAPVPASRRLSWARDISTALRALHTAGVVHEDSKPENVLLDERLEVYLIDFSGSCLDEQQGSAWESVRFFNPRSEDSDSTVQTDLFALGSTLYEIFTGMPPYRDLADDVVEGLFANGDFPSLDLVFWTRD